MIRWFILAGLLVMNGCAMYPQSRQLLTERPETLPPSVILEGVPFYPQTEFHCGPASLASLLNYQGYSVTPQELGNEIYIPGLEGSLQIEILASARARGNAVYQVQPELENLLQEVAAGNPVLVLQNLGLSWSPVWHYAVVIGYNLDKAEVVLHSGTEQASTMLLTTFERTWQTTESPWAIVVTSPERIPATADPMGWVNTLEALTDSGQIVAAYNGYRAATEKWPDNWLVHFGKGNLAYQQKQFERAAQAFLKVIQIEPERIEGWNNLAYTLAQEGCEEARLAANCAVRLGPEAELARSTPDDVRQILQQERPQIVGKVKTVDKARTVDRVRHCPTLPTCPAREAL